MGSCIFLDLGKSDLVTEGLVLLETLNDLTWNVLSVQTLFYKVHTELLGLVPGPLDSYPLVLFNQNVPFATSILEHYLKQSKTK